jgi:YtkA-like
VRFRRVAISLVLGWLLSHPCVTTVRGDGGTLRYWERHGTFEIAVFTAPNPFVAGPVDISVLVLDSASGEPVPDAKVSVKVEPMGRPGEAVLHRATTEAATNKLLHAAVFELPEPGLWVVEVYIEGLNHDATIRFKLEAANGPPHWMALWPWVCWPAPVILLYGIHQRLVWRKARYRTG